MDLDTLPEVVTEISTVTKINIVAADSLLGEKIPLSTRPTVLLRSRSLATDTLTSLPDSPLTVVIKTRIGTIDRVTTIDSTLNIIVMAVNYAYLDTPTFVAVEITTQTANQVIL